MTPFGLADADYWRSLFPGVQARVEQKAQITSRQPYVTTGGESIRESVSQHPCLMAKHFRRTALCLVYCRSVSTDKRAGLSFDRGHMLYRCYMLTVMMCVCVCTLVDCQCSNMSNVVKCRHK
jgi:hypothetical protein